MKTNIKKLTLQTDIVYILTAEYSQNKNGMERARIKAEKKIIQSQRTHRTSA